MGTRPAAGPRHHRPDRPLTGLGRAARALLLGAALAASLPVASARGAEPPVEPLEHFPTETVSIDAGGQHYAFKVWIAATEARRDQGLMWVKSLPADRGMLFLFERPEVATFWMKNTLIPLDLLFIAANGVVIRVAENARPLSEATISSFGEVTGVLELAGGTAVRLGLAPGARIRHPAFASRP